MSASNVELPASLAVLLRVWASLGNKYDITAADAPDAQACPEG